MKSSTTNTTTKTFDALIFGYYEGEKLIYVARTRNGFTPLTRAQLFKKFKGLEIGECPFANLPEAKSGRWGQGLTKAKMAECQWVKPVLVCQLKYTEWTRDDGRWMLVRYNDAAHLL